LEGGLVPVRGEKEGRKECGKVNIMQIHVYMYVNGKIIPVETILGIGGWAVKENGGVGEFKSDIFDIL
jgi:hypothetical protein